MRKNCLWATGILFMLLALPAFALADKINDLWVTGVAPGGERKAAAEGRLPDDAIHWFYSKTDKKHYLFLPAGADTSSLRLYFRSAAESFTAGGRTVTNGDRADFLKPGSDVEIACGTFRYTLCVMQSENIPALFITTESGSVQHIHSSKDHEETGTLALLDKDGSLVYDGPLIKVKGRGNSTFQLNKKPYQIKLSDSCDLFGMGKAKTWNLLAEYRDNSLLRNTAALAMAGALGLDYTSRFMPSDVYINNEYYGTYLLCEKVETGPNRVDIHVLEEATQALNEKPLNSYKKFGTRKADKRTGKGYEIPNNPADITGGYLLELERPYRYYDEYSGFVTKRGQPVVIKEPQYASREQVEYIQAFFQGFENAVFAQDGIDPDSGKHYSEFVDMDSLVKKYLLEEFSKNLDGNTSSCFFYKLADSQIAKAYAGPAWDYDIAFGNYMAAWDKTLVTPESFFTNRDGRAGYFWFPALYRQPDFFDAVKKTYRQDMAPLLHALLGNREESGGLLSLPMYADRVRASAAMNFVRWPVFNLKARDVKTGATYQENIAYLTNFIEKRMAFLDAAWAPEE